MLRSRSSRPFGLRLSDDTALSVVTPLGHINRRSSSSSSYLSSHVRDYQQKRRDGSGSSQASRNTPELPSGSSSAASSWLKRVQGEMIGEHDPLNGRYHPDYFRDPASGYAPVFAPRNYENGGAVEFFHPLSPTHYQTSVRDREFAGHGIERSRTDARDSRRALRDAAGSPGGNESTYDGSEGILNHVAPPSSLDTRSPGGSPSVASAFQDVLRTSTTQHRIGNMRQGAVSAVDGGPALHAGLDGDALHASFDEQWSQRYDDHLDEGLRIAHGLREKERFAFDVKQRSERLPFRGYDMDRFLAAQQGKLPGMNPFSSSGNLVAPGTAAEAQGNVRKGAVPSREARIAHAMYLNTVRGEPKLGEALVADVSDGLRGTNAADAAAKEQQRDARFGIGRQTPLVQDAGPDKRTLKRHKNDERLLKAMIFEEQVYAMGADDFHKDPVERNDVRNGVDHLLRTRFDIDRRIKNYAAGKPDPTERAAQFHGKPLQQEIDDFVFRRRNARGERSLGYFKPFPAFRDLRLQRVYRDIEGFPVMKARPDFLEWELFTRYRAHMEQRRDLALQHGLEPKPNETVEERDARRSKLDAVCERTPFDESRVQPASDELKVDAATLRAWFGFYFLPSPTITETVVSRSALQLFVLPQSDALGTDDKREHVLSARYFNELFKDESYRFRVGRGNVRDLVGRIPDPDIPHVQPQSVLQHFTQTERAVYDAYVQHRVQAHDEEWKRYLSSPRRWIAAKQQYGVVADNSASVEAARWVYDAERVSDGALITIGEDAFGEHIAKALSDPGRSITVDNQECRLLQHSRRNTTILQVRLEDGSLLPMEEKDFNEAPAETQVRDPNVALNNTANTYDYNRSNYVETQDKIWEEQCASGVEGWSLATHADGLRPGLNVLCRRVVDPTSGRRGAYQRGTIVQYHKQPFFNPEPRTVTVAFHDNGPQQGAAVEQVPLAELAIWQRQYFGPERTVGDATRRLNLQPRRYVNVADPEQEKERLDPHFLDKYQQHSADAIAERFMSVKEISELDRWGSFDTRRPENHRPLSINHRRDYVRMGYVHKYTPWDWIATQESEQPLLLSQIRTDDTGPSYYHGPNRYWRWKARPHGYIRNFEHEVRDLFQYIDGVTPWEKAKKIRTYWEAREHHPMPQFNRPEVAIHRNSMALLPAQLWETDKKTGRVKMVKDSVRDYQTQHPIPSWAKV